MKSGIEAQLKNLYKHKIKDIERNLIFTEDKTQINSSNLVKLTTKIPKDYLNVIMTVLTS